MRNRDRLLLLSVVVAASGTILLSHRRSIAATIRSPSNIPTRFHSSARKCKPYERRKKDKISTNDKSYYKSQMGEDQKLMKWFGSLCSGSYIEMGALDGKLFSNSYIFNNISNWHGVLIELSSDSYNQLVVNRPNEDALINAGVCSKPETLHYVIPNGKYNAAIGGIYEYTAPTFRKKWWGDISLTDLQVKEIECNTLDRLLLEYIPNQTYWDFFSLDVEGAEFAVLQSIDWDRIHFGIIVVEADEHNELKNLAMRDYLENRGYTFLEQDWNNYWFVSQSFNVIYKDLVY